MGQATSNGRPSVRRPPRRRRGARGKFAFIAVSSAICFAVGFILLWSLGSIIVGGQGFPWSSPAEAAISPVALQAQVDHPLEPLVDLRAFRDLSYVPVKGIYVSSYWAGRTDLLQKMLDIADTTEINAFVTDVKDDRGKITYEANVPLAKQLGLITHSIKDVDAYLATLAQHHIIPIARVVCFKDQSLAKARPDLAIRSQDGGLWADFKGLNYTNPYNHEVWEYIVEVAEDAARHGFREIQFDYVRFPTDGPISKAVYPGQYCSKVDAIAGFLAFAHQRLEKLGVWVSADVFGIVIQNTSDAILKLGQQIDKVAANVDVVCPMVYPSHYSAGSYNIDNPNASPYELITAAMKETAKRLAGTGAMGRPWLQDFSLGVKYGVQEVKAQIQAAEKQGFTEWILWDPALTYTEGALRSQGG